MVLDASIRSVALVRARVGLGDLLCSVPALRALRAHLPRARLVMISYPETAPIVERMAAYVDELMAFPGWPGIPERPVRDDDLAPFLARARARRFDLAVQMYGANPAAGEVVDALGARRSAGFFVPGEAGRDTASFLPYPHHLHEVDRHLALVRLLGAQADDRTLEFPVRRADERAAADLRAQGGLDGRPYALLHPGSTSPSRRWPPARWARVAEGLVARGLALGITGVRGEESLVRETRRGTRAPAADLCGRTSLGAFAALVAGAALVVGNDSGPAHLAAALGTPSVTVFLSGDPVRWAHGGGRHRMVRVQVRCNPCPHLSCPLDHRCAGAVTPASVLAEVDSAIGTSTLRPCSSTSVGPATT